ncbi:hypothetical protein PBI_JOHANN_39 [Microbacterium phage Johann]|uniref:Uncharacterized protein n=2 Tax=Goodmanvirus goodman TaxID=2734238 RepID=A0A3G3M0P8_9CAUD|nr:hypothetical protein HOU56_gp39 [Microbacterium phage Goodman]AYQ99495.1 hypothetical protein PBI_GOODMAN_39 [Microbacterium phage Goodman]AYQ99663.1 hypothetical protein PBI_JOHANN_39 [Microbacterium phage Johann]
MPDNRPRYPEETDMNLTREQRRHVAKWIYRARWILIAKVVAVAKLDDYTPELERRKNQELERLQERFEGAIQSLPIWLRSERFLDKHVVAPAERHFKRVGILQCAREIKALRQGWMP